MATFRVSLVSSEKKLFSDQADQVDLPGVEGDFGILAGHAPIVAMLRPGIVTIISATVRHRFVVLGGLAEFSQGNELSILADSASSTEDFDLSELRAQIEQMQADLATKPVGDELDRAIARLDHYKAIHMDLAPTTAF